MVHHRRENGQREELGPSRAEAATVASRNSALAAAVVTTCAR